jgi:hypothetical protein
MNTELYNSRRWVDLVNSENSDIKFGLFGKCGPATISKGFRWWCLKRGEWPITSCG